MNMYIVYDLSHTGVLSTQTTTFISKSNLSIMRHYCPVVWEAIYLLEFKMDFSPSAFCVCPVLQLF